MGSGASSLERPAIANEPELKDLVGKATESLSDDQLFKLVRQMNWHKRSGLCTHEGGLSEVCSGLIKLCSDVKTTKVPTKRFGRTEIQMPIVTCGGMRLQQTWMPDNLPISPKKINATCQNNLVECVRMSLSLGINHFETARFYGTSELQFVDAISSMIASGEIKREDVIIQTKVTPAATNEEFRKTFELSWRHMSKLGYIDLFSFHGASTEVTFKRIFKDEEALTGGNYEVALELQREGKIKWIGFSTHGTPKPIKRMIKTEKFDYVNLHYHYFGSYHASYYEDGEGGFGNKANVDLANSLDMGVFIISPFDKGGALYRPTEIVAQCCNPLSPMTFQSLFLWNEGAHTISIGIAKPSDFDEVVHAAGLYGDPEYETLTLPKVNLAKDNLDATMSAAVGEDWLREFWRGVPSMLEEESAGIAVCHILWLWGLVKAFGMVTFAQERYKSLEGASKKWSDKKALKDYEAAVVAGWAFNPGRAFEPSVSEWSSILGSCTTKGKVVEAMEEAHSWLKSSKKPSPALSDPDLNCEEAYSLVTWESFPGDSVTVGGVVLQNVSGGLVGAGGGKSPKHRKQSQELRGFFSPDGKMAEEEKAQGV